MQPKSIILFFYGYILFFRRHKDYEDRNEYCDLLNEAIRKDKEKENLQKN